jgi:hypothetical protein
MALLRGTLFDMRDYRLDVRTEPAVPKAGAPLRLTFSVFHPETGDPVRNFEVTHERRYHLFVISQDMQFFEHIHPEQGADGTWSIDVTLPKPGYYSLLSDFLPAGGTPQFLPRPLVTAGFREDLVAHSARLVPDTDRAQTIEDLTATIAFESERVEVGTYNHMSFRLTRAGTGEPVTDLQTYLGAFGHMLMISEDMVDYVHAHPIEMLPADADLEQLRGGPDVVFEGLMPKPGRYRAWTQVRYRDKVHTFTNTFEVLDPDGSAGR